MKPAAPTLRGGEQSGGSLFETAHDMKYSAATVTQGPMPGLAGAARAQALLRGEGGCKLNGCWLSTPPKCAAHKPCKTSMRRAFSN